MPLRDCMGRNCCAARVCEADCEGGPPPLVSRINPFSSRISRLWLIIFSRGFVFLDRLVTLDRLRGPKSLLRASMSRNFWIPLERVQNEIHILITSGHSRGFLSVSNKLPCLYDRINQRMNLSLSWSYKFESGRAAAWSILRGYLFSEGV